MEENDFNKLMCYEGESMGPMSERGILYGDNNIGSLLG